METQRLTIRFSPEQVRLLEDEARRRGINFVSTMIRAHLVEFFHLPTDGRIEDMVDGVETARA